jgi:ABC-type glutathione transport system ATPase component
VFLQTDGAPLLDVRGLTVEYCGSYGCKCLPVAGATCQTSADETVGILAVFGESGSGKTTFCNTEELFKQNAVASKQ